MFIDYVTLMLVNMVGGMIVLACFIVRGLDAEDKRNWSPVFGIIGLVAGVCGFVMTFTWPLPRPYNIAYGEMSVLFGVLFFAAAVTLAKGWDLLPLGIYAFFAGAAAVLLGVRIIDQKLTLEPVLSGIGFILSGTCGIFAGLVLWKRKVRILRITGALTLIAAAAIWAMTGYVEYWRHMVPPPK